jgi:hypothetical protein
MSVVRCVTAGVEKVNQMGIVDPERIGSIELYNIARRAKKNVVMLAYIVEDHGLRRKENQRDYQDRILSWLGHYLKGEPAEAWITDGKSFLERDAELKRLKKKKQCLWEAPDQDDPVGGIVLSEQNAKSGIW